MEQSRFTRLKWNIIASLAMEIVVTVCGLVIPRLMIGAFGSEVYGLATSITDALAYISLLEGGIGGVARAAMYGPLARGELQQVSNAHAELKRYLRTVGGIFVVYALALALGYQFFDGNTGFDWLFTFCLVIAIAISTFAEYFFSLSNSLLIHTVQRLYVNHYVRILTTVLNTCAVILLLKLRCNIVVVKLTTSLIFLLRPLILGLYVKKNIPLPPPQKNAPRQLTQKWVGLGQHLSNVCGSQLNVLLLTVSSRLAEVAVYSVHSMVLVSLRNVVISLTSGTDALFGEMLAKEERKELRSIFDLAENGVSMVSTTLYSVAAVLLPSFIALYTRGITDAPYHQPVFALLMSISMMLICMRTPYQNMVIASGRFRQVNLPAYGETVLQFLLVALLLRPLGLTGIAVASVVSRLFSITGYAWEISRNVLKRSFWLFWKRLAANLLSFALVTVLGGWILQELSLDSYFRWVLAGFLITGVSLAVNLSVNLLLYPQDTRQTIQKLLRRLLPHKK